MDNIKLIKRQGMDRHYSNGKSVVIIGACLAPWVYTNPGYYILGLHPERFSSGKAAAKYAFKMGVSHYTIKN